MSEPTAAPEVRAVGAEAFFRFQASVGGHTSRFDALVDLKEVLTDAEFNKVRAAAVKQVSDSIHQWSASVAAQPTDPGEVVPLPPPSPPPADPLLAAQNEGDEDERPARSRRREK